MVRTVAPSFSVAPKFQHQIQKVLLKMTGRAVVDIGQRSRVYILVLAVRQEISLFAHTEPYQATQLKIILYLNNFANTAQFGTTRVFAT